MRPQKPKRMTQTSMCWTVALKAFCLNKTFDPLASCEELLVSSSLQGSTLPKMGLPRATAFRFGQGHSEAVFNFYFNSRRDQNGRAKSTRWSVWQPCFWGCDMTLRTPPAASKVHQNNETTKAKKDDTNIHVLNCCVESFLPKQNLWSTCVMRRASCLEQLARFHTAKNGIATRYRFSLWTGPFRGCFQFLF